MRRLNLNLMKKYFFGMVFFALFLFFPFLSRAVTISPPKFEFNVKPGDTIEDTLMVINEFDRDTSFLITLDNVTADEGEEGYPKFLSDMNAPTGLAQWITINRDPAVIKSRGQYDFPFVINVPKDAQPGGHYGVICIGESQGRTGASMPSVIGDLCTLVLMNVDGDVIVDGKILEFSTDKEFYSSLPVNFLTRFKNSGTIYVKPTGSLVIKNIFGMRVASVEFNEEGTFNVLPQAVRRIPTVWQKKELPKDASEFIKELKNFAIGPYTAELNIMYGVKAKQTASSVTRFWVFPWQVMIAVLVILIVLYFVIKQYNKAVVRRALKKNE